MRTSFSSFVHGTPGIALLLLRLAIGTILIYHAVAALLTGAPCAPVAFHVALVFLAVMLVAGLWTPITGALLAVASVWEMIPYPPSGPQFVLIAVMAVAVGLLGPGAWSVDAWLAHR